MFLQIVPVVIRELALGAFEEHDGVVLGVKIDVLVRSYSVKALRKG